MKVTSSVRLTGLVEEELLREIPLESARDSRWTDSRSDCHRLNEPDLGDETIDAGETTSRPG